MKLDDWLEEFENVQQHGSYYMARCPAHDDSKQSLQVSERDDESVGLYCHRGCSTEDVVEAVGKKMKDLFPGFDWNAEPEAVYTYVDELGRPLYDVVRFPGKEFRQRRYVGDTVEWGIGDTRKVLYRLPELLAADPNRYVHVVEGEKDADAIWEAGGVATTNVGGGGKWDDSYTDVLTGRHVRIVVDKDKENPRNGKVAGEDHAKKVRDALRPVVAGVELVQAVEGKDAYDHLEAGYDLTEFEPWTPKNGLVLIRADRVKMRDVHWVPDMENMFAYGAITTLLGFPEANKSTFTCRLAEIVNRDGRDVLIISTEDDFGTIQRPRLQAAGADPTRCHFLEKQEDGIEGDIYFPQDVDALEKAIDETNAGLIIVDPIGAHLGGGDEGNNDPSVRRILSPIARLARKKHVAVVFVHHVNKSRSRNAYVRAGGSIAIPGVSRMALVMAHHPWDPMDMGRRVVATFKNNWGPKGPARVFQVEPRWVDGHSSIALADQGTAPQITASQLLGGSKEIEET